MFSNSFHKKYQELEEILYELEGVTLQLENLKNKLLYQKFFRSPGKEPDSGFKPVYKSRIKYGCYDSSERRRFHYKCIGCGVDVTPYNKYIITSDNNGYIFFCPDCKTPAFAYHYNLVPEIITDTGLSEFQ